MKGTWGSLSVMWGIFHEVYYTHHIATGDGKCRNSHPSMAVLAWLRLGLQGWLRKDPCFGEQQAHGLLITKAQVTRPRPGRGRPLRLCEGLLAALSCLYRLKENHILLSTDGPGRNVLKFKPPMCFSLDNAQHVVAKMDAILTGKPAAQGAADHVSKTSQ